MQDETTQWRKRLAFSAAALFFVGGLTGLLVGLWMKGGPNETASVLLASHLNALMGCFWLVALGWSLEWADLAPGKLALVCQLSILAASANWLVTLVKAFLGVRGVSYTGEGANDAIFIALTLTVVLPTLVATYLWMRGLWRGLRAG